MSVSTGSASVSKGRVSLLLHALLQNSLGLRSHGSASSQETQQIRHLLIHTGLLCIVGGSCRHLPCLGSGSVSGPCDLSSKLLWSRACKRSETLPLLTEAEPVETLMYLHLPPVVGGLLANQVL